MSLLASALAALLPAVSASAAPRTEAEHGPLWERATGNAADAPGRCGADRLLTRFREDEVYTYGAGGSLALDDQIRGMLAGQIRYLPWNMLRLVKTSDYYARRDEVLAKMTAALAEVPPQKRAEALGNYAMALLYLGEFKRVVGDFAPTSKNYRDAADRGEVDYALGLAHYRLGQDAEAKPFAERAFKKLADAPLDTRWLLMLVDSDLEGPAFFKNEHPAYTLKHVKDYFPKTRWEVPFVDATAEVGLSTQTLWGGFGTAAFFDADGDGWDDLFLERKFFPPRLYRNVGGKLVLQDEAKLGAPAPCNQLLAFPADFDNSGKPGLFRSCCNFEGGGPVQLLKNKGGFTFEDIAKEAGLGSAPAGTTACWGDYDLDGRLDLLVNGLHGRSHLFRNNGDGTFTDVTDKAGIRTPGDEKTQFSFGAMGCAFSDFRGKRYPDLFVQGWGWHQLYRNNGDGTFTDVTKESGLGDGSNRRGYMVQTLDYDNDGNMDILAGSYGVSRGERYGVSPVCTCSNLLGEQGFGERELEGGPTIFRNNGDGTFADMAEKMKFLPLGGMSYGHADWNNEGWEDLVIGYGGGYIQQDEPFAFYQNDRKGGYVNMTPFLMHGLWGKGHGIAFADVGHRGVMDLVLQSGGAQYGDLWPTRFLRNTTTGRHWLEVRLKAGPGTNASVIGGRVRVTAGAHRQTKDVSVGGTLSANSLTLHFGLGAAKTVDKLVVEWPNRKLDVTVLERVPADQAIEIDEAAGTWRRLWAPASGPYSSAAYAR